jgi:hypothetical protein
MMLAAENLRLADAACPLKDLQAASGIDWAPLASMKIEF